MVGAPKCPWLGGLGGENTFLACLRVNTRVGIMVGGVSQAMRIVLWAVLLVSVLIAGTAGAQSPLEPLDTSSPRATLQSFIANAEEMYRRYADYRSTPSRTTYEKLAQTSAKGRRLLDLSEVPPAARREVGAETRILLLEVLARVELPDLDDVPGAAVEQQGDQQTHPLANWRVPGTEITITRIAKGPRAGEYLFSADTVRRARSFYESARALPYRRPMPEGNLVTAQERFTGWLIPSAWVDALPTWANTPIWGQVAWKWIAVLALFGLAVVAVLAVYRLGRRRPWDGSFLSYLGRLAAPLAIIVMEPILRFLFRVQVNVTGAIAEAPDFVIEVASSLATIWIIWLSAAWLAEALVSSPKVNPKSLDAHLIRITARLVGIAALTVFLYRLAADLGVPVYGLVAGAGVDGAGTGREDAQPWRGA